MPPLEVTNPKTSATLITAHKFTFCLLYLFCFCLVGNVIERIFIDWLQEKVQNNKKSEILLDGMYLH